jgi:SPP1 gp7 family putative phage head morphogenesis protein
MNIAQYIGQAVYDIKMAANPKKQRLFSTVEQQNLIRIRQDVGKWRNALIAAEDIAFPQREDLYALYEDLLVDNHLYSVIQTRKLNVLSMPFKVIKKKGGQEVQEKTMLLQVGWFRQLCEHLLDSLFWGHTLVELGKMDSSGQLSGMFLIPRAHVCPEFGYVKHLPTDTHGLSYKHAPYNSNVVEAGSPRDLGLLMRAAPAALWKKNAFTAWAEYTQIFGMPLRKAKSSSFDSSNRGRLENMLKKMGQAAYVILEDGEDIEFVETGNSDAYMVYDKLIERTNAEMSKLILGQTMTTDNGSSRSQSEVHERVADKYTEADKAMLQDIINTQVLPKLAALGFPFTSDETFVWDETEVLEVMDQWTIVKGLLDTQKYKIPADYITKTFGVPVEAAEATPEPDGGQGLGKLTMSAKRTMTFKPPAWLRVNVCCEHESMTGFSEGFSLVDIAYEALTKRAWDSNGNILFDTEYYFVLNELLRERLFTGFGKEMGSLMGDIERRTLTLMEANLFHFSAGKTLAVVQELNHAVKAAKSFAEFEKATSIINSDYNRNWLRTEYNFTRAAAQNGSAWIYQKENADVLPYIQWRTVNDANVRDSHRALHGKVWDIRKGAPVPYPPTGWNCRCEMVPLTSAEGHEEIDNRNAKELLGKEWDNIEKWGFDVNRGETGEIFTANQMYAKTLAKPNTFGLKGNGLKPFAELQPTDYPSVSLPSNSVDEAKSILLGDKDENYLNDYANRMLRISDSTVKKHLQGKYLSTDQRRQDWASFVKETLTDPDEVFFIRDGKNTPDSYHYRYVKFYQVDGNLKAMNIYTEFENGLELSIKSWYNLDKPDELRAGSLVHKKK